MTDTRKNYEEKLDAQFDKWNAQIALLKAKADKAKAEGRIEYYKTIEALQHKQDVAETKLHQLKTAGDDAWEDLKQARKMPGMKSRQPFAAQHQNSSEQS